MINLMVANIGHSSKSSLELYVPIIKAQIENSLELGCKPEHIFILSNHDFIYEIGVCRIRSIFVELNKECLTGSKMFGVQWFMKTYAHLLDPQTVIFAHDLDAWQNVPFTVPEFKDAGITTYSNSKLNGGVVFWRLTSKDIVDEVVNCLKAGQDKEEPTINKLFTTKYKDRITIIDQSFNVGCSGFVKRAQRAERPIKISHFHPYNRIAWETHRLDRNGVGIVSIDPRLENILRKYFPNLATELSEEGKARQLEIISGVPGEKKKKKKKKEKKESKADKPGKSIKRKIDANFYKRDIRPDRQATYEAIVDSVMDMFPHVKSVIDYGCGSGWMLYYFWNKYSCQICGIEPNLLSRWYMSRDIQQYVNTADLRNEIKIEKKFDLAMCLEVVEHMEAKYAQQIISNITQASDLLIFSAAVPGQGGSEHVNEQVFPYWEEKLNSRSFFIDQSATDALRRMLRKRKVKHWYSSNISVLIKK